jgi:transcription initiation factor IIE alpha subunit
MSTSKCPKCGKGVFQFESMTPIGANRDILTVVCHTCNSIVGTLDYLSSGEEINELKIQINILHKKLDTINQNLGQLMNGMKLLYNKVTNGK